ncbi:hypothetical protein NE848_09905 [Gramella jeungdoensis]|uniref:DUF3944 domain-containing protein n=1 Tax=Gramella jeungdoensis TaxID=708091 RepID=A0ABT0Z2D5_9FLAO|nr:hypothetical protein [Gramella jeungdoensis]MCM8569694.1 hypothetical protein [Gramella jeungdoensis]
MERRGFKMPKEEYEEQSKLHSHYLSNKNFNFELPYEFFSAQEALELQELGNWYSALERGQIKPITSVQFSFLFNLKNLNTDYIGKGEIWIKYRILHNQWGVIFKILSLANDDELKILSEILKTNSQNAVEIIVRLQTLGSNILGKIDQKFPNDKYLLSYRGILMKVAKKLKFESDAKNKEIEHKIIVTVLKRSLKRMTPEQKKKFETELRKMAKENGSKYYATGVSLAFLTSAQLSGFGVYLLATTALSTLGSALGLTLSFAAYTFLTSALSTIIGPVGWAALGLYTIWKVFDVNYKKLIPAIIYLHWLREKYMENVIYLNEKASS